MNALVSGYRTPTGRAGGNDNMVRKNGYDWRAWLLEMPADGLLWFKEGDLNMRGSIGRAAKQIGWGDVRVTAARNWMGEGAKGIVAHRLKGAPDEYDVEVMEQDGVTAEPGIDRWRDGL